MADVERTTRKQSLQMASVIAGTALAVNALFRLGTWMYFEDKPDAYLDIARVRWAFFTLSLVVAAMAYLAALAPRLIGHALATAIGLASIVGGIAALSGSLPPVMGATLLAVGAMLPVLAWRSWQHARGAWAFLIAIVTVFATIAFFGAPKIRALLGLSLWHALIIPGLQIVCVIALAMLRGEYRDRTAAA